MSIANITALSIGSGFRSVFEQSAAKSGYALTVRDRVEIERLLRGNHTQKAPNPALLKGLLRHKLRVSDCAAEPPAADLVRSGSVVTYMITGGGARSAIIAMRPGPPLGQVKVASLLGATLIGMRKLQKVPLLRDDGSIESIVVLDVQSPCEPNSV